MADHLALSNGSAIVGALFHELHGLGQRGLGATERNRGAKCIARAHAVERILGEAAGIRDTYVG